METPDTLRHLLAQGESARLEFKSAKASLEGLGRAICALLNSGGGQIAIGVTDQGQVEGKANLAQIEELLRPLAGGGGDEALLVPDAIWDLSDEPLDDGGIVLIDVPGGADPPYVFQNGIYIRTGATTRQATPQEIRRLIERRYLQGPRWERQTALGVEIADLDQPEILKTAQIAADKRGWRFHDPSDPVAILEDLNLFERGRLTNAAVILFAKEAGHIFPQSQIRLTAYQSDKAGAVILDDRMFRGHFFANLEAFEAFVTRHVSVISHFSAGQTLREDSPLLPYWPIREGFRNAMMHRNYESIYGQATASLYAHRLEIWSYGSLPAGLSVEGLKHADRSLPVNPDIAQVAFLRGLVELLGRGTRKIVEEFRSLGWPEPTWKQQAGGITLTLRTGQAPGELPEELNQRQVELLQTLRPGASVNLAGLKELLQEAPSERSLRNDLSGLVSHRFLARQGRGKSTFYIRTEKPLT